jgi:pyridoxal phosphate enzyme (YggS family)
MSIESRLKAVNNQLRQAESACGRASGTVRLLAVSKLQPVEHIVQAMAFGQIDFGENYVQEALDKQKKLIDKSIRWHFIGRIQSKKVKALAGAFDFVHSVDRVEIIELLERVCAQKNVEQKILLQVNFAGEAQKGGAAKEDVSRLLQACVNCPHIRVFGLMVMPPLTAEPSDSREFFAEARMLLDKLRAGLSAQEKERHPLTELSMGTSHDYREAIQEGATWVRVGTDVFGPRPVSKES